MLQKGAVTDYKAVRQDARVWVTCPACGQRVKAVARDGRVKGYCAVAKQRVNFLIEPARRDSQGHFIKGNVPWNKA